MIAYALACAVGLSAQTGSYAYPQAVNSEKDPPLIRRITPQIPDANRYDMGKVFLENADKLLSGERLGPDCQILKGNVKFRRANMTLSCDSAYFRGSTNSLDAFGHVVMTRGDTLKVYADILHYFGYSGVAHLRRNVKLINRNLTLTTDSLDYDSPNNLLSYKHSAVITDGKGGRLTSQVGKYELDTKEAQFSSKVHLTNNRFDLYTEVLDYNTHTQIATIVTDTDITSKKDGSKIHTNKGWYNMARDDVRLFNRSTIENKDGMTIIGDDMYYNRRSDQGEATGNVVLDDPKNQQRLVGDKVTYDRKNDKGEAHGNVVLTDAKNKQTLTGNSVTYDRKNGVGTARGNVVIVDEKNKVILEGDYGYSNEKKKHAFVTGHAKAREFSQKDTLFVHADTLSTLTLKDSVRTFSATGMVRFWRKDIQGICHHAHASQADSILNLYGQGKGNAVVWNENRQVSGLEINVHMMDSTVDWATLPRDGMMIEYIGENYYNQLCGRKMRAGFENKELRTLDVEGNVMVIFYPQENDSTYNKQVNTESSYLSLVLHNKNEIEKIKMWPKVTGKVTPLFKLKRSQFYLPKFEWRDALRPKGPEDIFNTEGMKSLY